MAEKDNLCCRDRLIEAAREVFSRDGIRGATTRQIALQAGVNEVTLFRQFESKLNLLTAVMKQRAEEQMEALKCDGLDGLSLRHGLLHSARVYDEVLTTDEGLIRTVIGEAGRNPECARKIAYEAVEPWRKRLREFLVVRQQAGEVRADLDLAVAVDHFTGMLLAGMLRRTSPWRSTEYAREDYVATSVEIFFHGVRHSEPSAL